MAGKIERDAWNPGFLGAMEIEFIDFKDKLTFEDEHTLSKEPLRMDLLIIKKDKDAVIQNQIGQIFRQYNVIEYKSPEAGLSIDDYSKATAYAYLYKSMGKTADEIPLSELTVTLIRDTMPRELFKAIRGEGGIITEKYPGIYYIEGIIQFPTQFILTKSLDKKMHTSLRLLTKHLSEEDAELFITMASKFTKQGDRHNADALLQVSVSANRKVFERVKRKDPIMCEALKELMKDDFKAVVDDERTRVASEMLKKNFPLSIIEEISKLPEDTIRVIAQNIGVSIVS